MRPLLHAAPMLVLVLATGCAGRVAHLSPAPLPATVGSSADRDAVGEAAEPTVDRAKIVETATSMIGAPYRYGGSSPEGFDCSGLVVFSYASAGIDGLPRSAAELRRRAQRVDPSEIEPGDLLFFDVGRRGGHVAIYLGERTFIHAPSSGRRVMTASLDDDYWRPRLEEAGRLRE